VSSGSPVIIRDTVPINGQARRFIRLNVTTTP